MLMLLVQGLYFEKPGYKLQARVAFYLFVFTLDLFHVH